MGRNTARRGAFLAALLAAGFASLFGQSTRGSGAAPAADTAAILPLAISWRDDEGIDDTTRDGIERCLQAALVDLGSRLLLPDPGVEVRAEVRFSGTEPTGCSSSDFVRTEAPPGSAAALLGSPGPATGRRIYGQLLAAYLLDPAAHGDRPSHFRLVLNRGQLASWWFDPDPATRTLPLPPRGRVDACTVLLHELLHALCFNGWLDSATGRSHSPNGTLSPYDSHVTARDGRLWFTGPRTAALAGGPLPLTRRNYKHYGDVDAKTAVRLADKLMYGEGHLHPFRAFLSPLDLAILADCGLPVRGQAPAAAYMALPASGQEERWSGYSAESLARLDAFIRIRPGTIPLLLEVPHDGLLALPGLPQRRIVSGGRDTNCAALADSVASALESSGPGRPWVLILDAGRDWLDVNQDPGDTAYGDPFTRDLYDRYYYRLYGACREIMAEFGRGFQLSIHCGGNLGRDDVYFGTNGGASIRPFRALFGDGAFQGADGLPGLLAARGYRIPGYGDSPFHRGWTGGVVARYCHRDPLGMDGVQIEVERTKFMHDGAARSRLAGDLAGCLEAFLERHYP